jgi:hypothetical protein
MQEIGFGKICDLPVEGGEPVLKRANVLKRRKLNKCKLAPVCSGDFILKSEHIEFFKTLDEICDGVIACLDIQNGLPSQIDIVENA